MSEVDGGPVEPYTLGVTQVYRREDGEWKVVHRHGDQLPIDRSQPLPGEASTSPWVRPRRRRG